ncbi:hypothetical protein V5O48_014258 [Marasmius crinis-equi]|uniref:F-box domain-containing protein n=1 Tax=Marasmius crinis-equi TaxID=585013 RepID=A0ABR3EXU3_9AGAR
MANAPDDAIRYICRKCTDTWTPPLTAILMDAGALRQTENSSDHERREVIGALEEEERLLIVYNEELHRQGQIVEEIHTRQRALAKFVTTRRSYLSAVRKLPTEVVEEIFSVVCFSDTYTFAVFNPKDRTQVVCLHPVELSHIAKPMSNYKPLLGLYLANSADRPLTVLLRDATERPESHARMGSELVARYRKGVLGSRGCHIVDTVMKYARRIKHLIIDGVNYEAFQPIKPKHMDFLILETFDNASISDIRIA